eukprot:SM000035S13056  [mRNA]  locus=s35:118432:120949:- [translate_table: standard]
MGLSNGQAAHITIDFDDGNGRQKVPPQGLSQLLSPAEPSANAHESQDDARASLESPTLTSVLVTGDQSPTSLVHVGAHSDEARTPAVVAECRICQEEDQTGNLETPCACRGSLQYAHRKCVQRWCLEKGNLICEICHKPYQPGYTAPPPLLPQHPVTTIIDFREQWFLPAGHPLRTNSRAHIDSGNHQLLDLDYDTYTAVYNNGAHFRSAALTLLALLLLRHALQMIQMDDDSDDEIFTVLLFRAVAFLVPCYIIIRAFNIFRRRRQQQESALAGAEIVLLQGTVHDEHLPPTNA